MCVCACVCVYMCETVNQSSSGHLLELVSFTYSQTHKGRGTQRSERERNGRERGINLNVAGVGREATAWHTHHIYQAGTSEASWLAWARLLTGFRQRRGIWLAEHGHADREETHTQINLYRGTQKAYIRLSSHTYTVTQIHKTNFLFDKTNRIYQDG